MEKRTRLALFAILIVVSLFMVQLSVANAAKPVTYTPLDLTTFDSYASEATDINDLGQVVGVWRATPPSAQAFVWSPDAGETDLAPLAGQSFSFATCINNLGQIAGFCGVPTPLPPRNHAVLWTPESTITKLNSSVSGQTRDINDAGQVVGFTETQFYVGSQLYQNPDRAFIWTAETGMTYIQIPSAHASLASGINNKGQVVGYTFIDDADGVHVAYRAFSCTAHTGAISLPVPVGATVTMATDVNDKGEIVGYYVKEDGSEHAILWTKKGDIVELGTLPGLSNSVAVEINEKGQVVGTSYTPPTDRHAFVWTAKAGMIDIGGLSGASQNSALAINAKGQIAGISLIGTALHGVVWYPT